MYRLYCLLHPSHVSFVVCVRFTLLNIVVFLHHLLYHPLLFLLFHCWPCCRFSCLWQPVNFAFFNRLLPALVLDVVCCFVADFSSMLHARLPRNNMLPHKSETTRNDWNMSESSEVVRLSVYVAPWASPRRAWTYATGQVGAETGSLHGLLKACWCSLQFLHLMRPNIELLGDRLAPRVNAFLAALFLAARTEVSGEGY